jgi:anti-sigma factor RsiW
MSMTCEGVQDLLPELASGRLEGGERQAVAAHIEACGECRGALETLALLAAAPPSVPAGLEARIRSRLRDEFAPRPSVGSTPVARARRRWLLPAPAWGLAAAAVVALVMGRTLLSTGPDRPELLALGEEDIPLLLADDGMIAGGPVLDGLTDDDLALLLEELDR